MPHGGDIEVELVNDDLNTHCVMLPSNRDRQFLWMPIHSRGRADLNLDCPGCYWFSSPIGNDEGRGLTGAIVVLGAGGGNCWVTGTYDPELNLMYSGTGNPSPGL